MPQVQRLEDIIMVIVAWSPGPRPKEGEDEQVNVLCYGDKRARTYRKDRLDSRCLTDPSQLPPYFDDPLKAMEYLAEHRGIDNVIQLDVRAAAMLGLI